MQNMTTVKTGKNWGNVKGRENMREIEKTKKKSFLRAGLEPAYFGSRVQGSNRSATDTIQFGEGLEVIFKLKHLFLYCFCIVIIIFTFF